MVSVAKNYTKGYSDVQAKVRDATSNDPWGPSGTQMNEIAQLTYNQNDFVEIMEMLDKRLNDKGKNWRHVFKALTLLDYCLHAGSENVVIYFRDNAYLVKTLKEFQYIDEDGKDQGANVRQKAKDITNLLTDESRLRQERRSRASMRDRMTKGGGADSAADENTERRQPAAAPSSRRPRDEDELKRAMEASKKTFEQEVGKSSEDSDLKRALELSEQEERDRAKAVDDANSRALFDDVPANNGAATSANPFPLVDTGLQPQYTQLQPQFTSFNPYFQAQQQQQQQMMQAQWEQQQAQLEWARLQAEQQQLAQQQQQQLAQQQLAQQQFDQQQFAQQQFAQQQFAQQQFAQQQLAQQQFAQQQQLYPQPTGFGSNNPFALGQGASAAPPPMPSLPSASSPTPITNGGASSPSPAPASGQVLQVKQRQDENAALASLYANRDGGVDTFGNFGNLRYGANAGRLVTNQTGAPAAGGDQPFFSI